MNSARRPLRPLGTLLVLSLAVAAGLASCANGETTGVIDGSASTGTNAGHANAGAGGAAGHAQGGMSAGGMSTMGGTLGNAGSGNVGGTGTAGGPGSGGAFGTGGSVGLAGGAGTSSFAGSSGASGQGGMSVGGAGGRMGGAGTFGQGAGRGGASNGGTSSSAGTSSNGGFGNGGGIAPPPDIQGGQSAWGSRYWDCCKPACGWSANVGGRSPAKSCDKQNNPISDNAAKNACESGGTAYACWGDRPWAVGDRLSYGFAAKNDTCGRCFDLQFNGTSHNGSSDKNSQSLNGKHLIVQVINNGAIASDQFDLLIPGGGVGALDACSNNQWPAGDLGAQYGGFLAGCNGDHTCVQNKCNTIFAGKQDLLDGCTWFLGWFGGADNPNFTYKQIACPSDITQRSGLSDPG